MVNQFRTFQFLIKLYAQKVLNFASAINRKRDGRRVTLLLQAKEALL